jgi:hypothetical protein
VPTQTISRCGGTAAAGDYAAAVLASSGLLAYWRLGEAASPFADTSGRFPGAEADAVVASVGTAYTTQVLGALDPTYDDGAILFNGAAGTNDYIQSTNSGTGRFNFAGAAIPFSVACFIRVNANANTFTAAAVNYQYSSPATGWAINVYYPARTLTWERQQIAGAFYFASAGSVAAGQYMHVCGTYSATGVMILYVNGVEVDRVTGIVTGLPTWNLPVQIGGALPSAGTHYRFDGRIDEVSIWDVALSAAFVAELAAMLA